MLLNTKFNYIICITATETNVIYNDTMITDIKSVHRQVTAEQA